MFIVGCNVTLKLKKKKKDDRKKQFCAFVLVEIKEIQAKTPLKNKSDKVSYKLKTRVEEKKRGARRQKFTEVGLPL